jgi:hypothetical protein
MQRLRLLLQRVGHHCANRCFPSREFCNRRLPRARRSVWQRVAARTRAPPASLMLRRVTAVTLGTRVLFLRRALQNPRGSLIAFEIRGYSCRAIRPALIAHANSFLLHCQLRYAPLQPRRLMRHCPHSNSPTILYLQVTDHLLISALDRGARLTTLLRKSAAGANT